MAIAQEIQHNQKPNASVTLRAVILGLALIPVNSYCIMANHLKYWSTLPTTISLIYNVIITLMVLIPVNFLIKRFLPRFALTQGEFLTIYVMLSISSAIAGHDMMQTVVPTIPDAFWFATPENEWKELFWRHLPPWLIMDHLSSLTGFYEGDSTFHVGMHFRSWLRPILWWTVFLTVLIWVMICLNILLRRQWIERERLAYPIVQVPLEITRTDGRLFKSKMMWLGFAISGGIDLINGIHALVPSFLEIPIRHAEIGQFFTEKPWSAVGWVPVYILSFAVGLAFLMPLEMSFSVWFFYLFWKMEYVVGEAIGLKSMRNFPYRGAQVMGGYLAIGCFALIGGRRYFINLLKNLFRNTPGEEQEPMRYRWAVLGLIGGIVFLLAFSYKGGMALWTAGVYFLIYYLLSISIARVRAEVGPPTNEVSATPHQFLTDVFGSRRLSPGTLTMTRLYMTFNRGSRAHLMPHTLEGFKVADAADMNSSRLVWAMLLATVVGVLAAFWGYLVVGYDIGTVSDLGIGGYNALQGWLYHPLGTDFSAVAFMGVGFLFTGFLWWLRTRFPFWPFHPAGYLIGSSGWTVGWLWFSIFVSWAIKAILLKVGGIRLYRKVFPLFLGILLGEFIIGGAWVLIRLFWDIGVYSFYR